MFPLQSKCCGLHNSFSRSIVQIPKDAQAATGDWQICNQTPEKVDVAIGYKNPDTDEWVSQGWWSIAGSGGCHHFGRFGNRYLYFYSDGFEGSTTYCAPSRAFKIAGLACPSSERRGFREVHLNTNQNWTTNLTSNTHGNIDD